MVCPRHAPPRKFLFALPHFGLVVTFAAAAEVAIHDDAMNLNREVRALIGRFGPVIFRNTQMESGVRSMFHRNIFPHLRFHVDRGPDMVNQYSCFTRDPLDPEQRPPRASSTLFIANIVAWLEMVRNAGYKVGEEIGVRPSYDLFAGAHMAPLLGDSSLNSHGAGPTGPVRSR